MDQSSSMKLLNSLWSGCDLEIPKCCHCGHAIESNSVLARTFALESQHVTGERFYTERVDVQTLSQAMLIYHRHLECLFKSIQYVAISHVWHPQVAELQYKRGEAEVSTDEVALIVREVPVRIYLGMAETFTEPFEVWHDYISVPQWQQRVKSRIIQSIPQIFNRASLTVACLSDVDAENFRAMRQGGSVYKTCRGVSNICNSRWFSRVWTAMEFTQSRELRAMMHDFTLIDDHASYRPFLQELLSIWSMQNIKLGNVQDSEKMVGMGSNLVPWQLGPLELVRQQNLKGVKTNFGTAHEMLSRRCVTVPRDFFHALLGILKPHLTEPELSADLGEAMLQVARSCIKDGDFSPLLMVPASSQLEPDEVDTRSYGYDDLLSYSIGHEVMPPKFTHVTFRSGNPRIKCEDIGDVQFITRASGGQGDISSLCFLIKLTIDTSGDNVDDFVETIGRLYGQVAEKIFHRLNQGDRSQQLQDKLKAICDSDLPVPDDVASWIAEATGLSDWSFRHPKGTVSPLVWLNAHGGTLHLGEAGGLISVTCPSCRKRFLIRVALLQHESRLTGARAYRIPGLQYHFTLQGGAGLVVKDGRSIARFLWGVPTCQCRKLEEIDILLDDLPLPRPNKFHYGNLENKGWFPLRLQTRMRV